MTLGAAEGRRVVVRAGNYQAVRAGRPFSAQLTVAVVDGTGTPEPGVRVTFTVASGDAAFSHGSRSAVSTTGGTGAAISQVLAAGGRAGNVRVVASAGIGVVPTTFALRVLPVAGPRRPGR